MKNLRSKIAGYAIWLLILLLAVSIVKNLGRSARIRGQIQEEKDKIAKIEAENERLGKQLALTQSADFIEKEVRDKLGLAKEGEAVVVLPDEEILRKMAPKVQIEADTLPDPNWIKWKKLFF